MTTTCKYLSNFQSSAIFLLIKSVLKYTYAKQKFKNFPGEDPDPRFNGKLKMEEGTGWVQDRCVRCRFPESTFATPSFLFTLTSPRTFSFIVLPYLLPYFHSFPAVSLILMGPTPVIRTPYYCMVRYICMQYIILRCTIVYTVHYTNCILQLTVIYFAVYHNIY